MKAYIRSAAAISPQDSFDGEGWLNENVAGVNEKGYFSCQHPDYKAFIKPAQLRRMSPVIRMGVAASFRALEQAGLDQPGAIVTGTGLGCVRDTARFLTQMIENKEELLNPTAFIQSTHNTVSGQIALMLGCRAYNLTFSQESLSFESALLDAQMCLEQGMGPVLLGGMDEIVDESYALIRKSGCRGIPGEGATFFVLDSEAGKNALALVEGMEMTGNRYGNVDWRTSLDAFLESLGISAGDVDLLVSGHRDEEDGRAMATELAEIFPSAALLGYKHLVGEYHTASAFATWLAAGILSGKPIPRPCRLSDVRVSSPSRALLINRGMKGELSLMLLSSPLRQ